MARFLLLLVTILLAAFASAQEWEEPTEETQKLTAVVVVEEAHFGISVAVFGDVVVVGTPRDEVDGVPFGSAYVFCFDEDDAASKETPRVIMTPPCSNPAQCIDPAMRLHVTKNIR